MKYINECVKEKWWERDYKKCLDRFLNIGFTLHKEDVNAHGHLCREYKYRPSYMNDSHYTLVLFNNEDFRLYIHKNEDGSFIDLGFQISLYQPKQIRFIEEGLDKEFVKETREEKITILSYVHFILTINNIIYKIQYSYFA